MPYDKLSFLAGVAAGRNMKSFPWLESKISGLFSLTIRASASNTMTYGLVYYFKGHIWWGDGTEEDSTSYSANYRTHTYATEGIYSITLLGAGWGFSPGATSTQKKCLISVDRPFLPLPDDIPSYVFYYDISYLFRECSNLKKLADNLFINYAKSGFPVTLPVGMFDKCTALTALPWGLFRGVVYAGLDTVNYLCRDCESLSYIPEDLFSNETFFANATRAELAFSGCKTLEEIPGNMVKPLTNVISFLSMFRSCLKLKEVPDGFFAGMENARSFEGAFSSCTALETLPMNTFSDCPNAVSFKETFSGCSEILSFLPPLWSTYPDANGTDCYRNCIHAPNYADVPEEWR